MGIFSTVFDIQFSTNFPLPSQVLLSKIWEGKQSFQSIRQTQDCPECIEGQSKIASEEATSEIQKTSEFFSRFLC
ncbi:MAG: hypothetical protein COX35_01785 [Candidatus Nealsonbacteria bacterium CG23_combo_of_CG06-09_8_20_14_all_37_18]|uniref:Uncharacterized protein n=1 Tax=Candidatus Nealsonbacteria bacterium CG23_combo_of_CG06-09_8_20_14_all_37_18 TaxID=1974720 RepID=A0A2G9YYC7_9BACT|nr:MAG: hypothetical protein COX35_01785 [Candidatus Nealsonbacteria bacterium CG23_combo_of_CG06-09_8_20_14_all_37_18]